MSYLDDEMWMDVALRLARKGDGRTSPNPMVGCVIVSGGTMVGTGWHKHAGAPHAEVVAIRAAGSQASGADLYVNLEPCCHKGTTGPCVDEIVKAGVARVVVAMRDPDSRVNGKGVSSLSAAGLAVEVGVKQQAARNLNRAYVTHRTHGRPYVTYKCAISLDGRTSALDGSSKWITGSRARDDAHRLRRSADAICVGVGTILADDPSLDVRLAGTRRHKHPLKVVADSTARTPPEARIFSTPGPVHIAVSPQAPRQRVANLERAGAKILTVGKSKTGVSLRPMLKLLADEGTLSLLVEGGPKLAGAFLGEGLIDRYVFYLAPKLLGDSNGAFGGWAATSISDARILAPGSVRRLGEDVRIEAFPPAVDPQGDA